MPRHNEWKAAPHLEGLETRNLLSAAGGHGAGLVAAYHPPDQSPQPALIGLLNVQQPGSIDASNYRGGFGFFGQ
jgi:hypothetical protein